MICIAKWQKIAILHRTYICFLSLCLSCQIGFAQDFWQPANGPTGGFVQALATGSSNRLFAGTGGGVFRSTDNGSSWTAANSGMANASVYSLAVNSTGYVFAGTGGGMFRSTDGGGSWTAVNSGLTSAVVWSLAINSSGQVFAGTDVGVFRSTDNGSSWTAANSGMANAGVYSLAINSNGHVFAGTGGGLFRSTDGGGSWTVVNSALTNVYSLAINSTGYVFAAPNSGGAFRSTDNGQSWTAVSGGLTNSSVRSITINSSGQIFAGTWGAGVFRSTDNGSSWIAPNSGLTNLNVFSLAINSTGFVFAGTVGGGVFRSTDGGGSWAAVNNGLASTFVSSVAINSSDYAFAGTDYGVFRSTDNGSSWTALNTGLTNTNISTLATNSSGHVFSGTWGGGVFRSTDAGGSWTAVNSGLMSTNVHSLAINSSGYVFVAIDSGVFRSTDNGGSWTLVNSGLTNVSSLATNSTGRVFAATLGAGIFRSTDNGGSWSVVNSGLTRTYVFSLTINSSGYVFAGTDAGVFRSTDDGRSWTAGNSGMRNGPVLTLVISSIGHVFAGNYIGGGVFQSIDNGSSWTAVSSGLTNTDVRSLVANSAGYVFAGTFGGGVFRSAQSTSPTTSPDLVQVTGGTFQMGSTTGNSDETPVHSVTLGAFYIDKTEVTYEKWTDVRNWGLTHGYTDLTAGRNGYTGTTNHPVTEVNWYDVLKWCNTRSEKDGLTPVYYTSNTVSTVYRTGQLDLASDAVKWTANGYRLPTEAEWEFAAKGGMKSQGYIYSGSNTIDGVAWYVTNSGNNTHPVSTKGANELGLYDMSGNVWEWCCDWYGTYGASGQINPKGPTSGTNRVLRGGSFYGDNDSYCRVANRDYNLPNYRVYAHVGFRSVKSDSITTIDSIPSTPQNLLATAGNGQVTLKWNKIPDTDLKRYRIYRGTASPANTLIDSTSAGNPNDTTRTITGLTNGQTYYFRVTAVDSAGNESGYSNEVSAIPSSPTTNLAHVTGSTFQMGSSTGNSDEIPVHSVTLGGFYIDKTEITSEKWTDVRIWGLTHGYSDLPAGQNGYNPSGSNNPVTSVNWYEILKWCNARSEKDGLTPAYCTSSTLATVYRTGQLDLASDAVKWTANGYRLPTEAEWEFAARGGTKSQGYTYSGSNTIDSVAWYAGTSGNSTHAAGTKGANELGLYDMSGNVWEWCWDWYGTYSGSAKTDPKGPTSGSYRVIRGGSFAYEDYRCRVAVRNINLPVNGYFHQGFRCVQTDSMPSIGTIPSTPHSLVATAGNGQVFLKWNKNAEIDFLRYRIYRSTSPNPTTKVDSTTGGIADTVKTITGLTNGTTYYFRVTAVDSAGNESGYSNQVSAVPTAPLLAPVLLSPADGAANQAIAITLRWGKSVGAVSYRVQVASDSNFSTGVIVNDSTVTDTTKSISGLNNSARYYWRVNAKNVPGTSPFSSKWSFTTTSAGLFPGEYSSDANTVLLLHMNELSGSTVSDASTFGSTGTATGTTTVDGRFGKARNFNGTSDYVQGATSQFSFGPKDFTLEAWIKTSSPSGEVIFATGVSEIGMYLGSGGFFDLDINNGQGSSTNLNGKKVNDGRWHHVAAVRIGNQGFLYIDGSLDFIDNLSQNPNPSTSFRIGAIAASYFNGLIDEVRISNKARSPQEFNLQLPPKNLSAAASETTINLSWQNGGGAVPLMRYKIYRGTDSTNVSLIDSTTTQLYSSTGLSPGTRYFYRLRAVDSTGFEGAMSWATNASIIPQQLLGEYTADANTVLLMHMNETSGSTVSDASGNGNNGTAIGTTVVDGKFGKTRSFNGVSERISIPSTTILNASPYLSLEAWIKVAAFSGNNIVVRKNGPNEQNGYYLGFAGSGTILHMAINTKIGLGTNTTISPAFFLDGRWHHIAGTYDGNTARVYIDGVLVDQDVFGVTIGTNSTDPVSIGANDVYGEYLNGLIDEVRISNKARTPQEFNLQLPPKNLSAAASGTTINLSWQNGGGAIGLLRYKVYRGPDSINVSLIDSATSPAYSDVGVTPGTRYCYRMSAVDSTGFEGAKSYAASATSSAILQPPTIASFSPTSGPVGSTVTIRGTNFSTTAANNIIYFGAVRAAVTSATSTSLGVTAPTGATYAPVTVTANGLTAYSPAPFIVTFPGGGSITDTSFAAKLAYGTGTNPKFVGIGDIDGDGKPDVVVGNDGSNTVSVLRNTSTSGNISFATKGDFVTGNNPESIAIGDIDGDGKLDLALANASSSTVSVLRNTSTSGNISLAAKVDLGTGSLPFGVAIGDIDGDGKLDIAVANYDSNTVSVLRNTSTSGNISFAAKVDYVTGNNPVSIAIGDIDGDGKLDIVVTNNVSNTVSVLRNTGTSGNILFSAKVDYGTGIMPNSVAIGDIDGDGKLDIATANYASGGTSVSVLRNTSTSGSVSFVTKVDYGTGSSPRSVTIGDIDGDGKVEIIVGNYDSHTISVLRNTSTIGNISFAAKVDFGLGYYPWGVSIGDIDGDGKLDIAAANFNSNTLSVSLNAIGTSSAPSAPTLTSPADGTTGVPVSPMLSWGASAGATSYRLQVSSNSTFTSTVFDDSSLTATSRQVGPLSNNTKYYWRVSATNAAGTSAYSPVWSFTTIIAAPAAPVLASPADRATGVSINPTLGWNAATGATSYRVQLSTLQTFASTLVDDSTLTGTSKATTGLTNNTVYYWRVNAKNAGGTSSFSATQSFTTVVVAPATPALATPADGAVGIAVTTTLSWTAVTGATTYRIQLSTSSGFTTTVVDDSTVTGTSRLIGPLTNSTNYYWRVSASNAGGTSAYSLTRSFTTIIQAPDIVSLTSPSDGATNQPVSLVLSWSAAARAATYRLQLSTSSTFASVIVDDSTLAITSYQAPSLANGTLYYWRVSAKNAGGVSAWSSLRSFTTVVSLPSAPTLITPLDNDVNVSVSPTLNWNTVSGATSYRLQVSTTSDFAATVFDQSGLTSTSRTVTALANGTKYFWRVSASNVAGTGPYSPTRSFTTFVLTPAAPVLSSPGSGSSNQPTTITLSWNASTGATTYRLQVSQSAAFTTTVFDDSTLTSTSKQIGPLSFGTTYYWRASASNTGGSSSYSPTASFTTIPTPAANVSISTTVSFATKTRAGDFVASDYRVVGLPGTTSIPIASVLSGAQKKDWQVYWDNGSSSNYFVEYDGSSRFEFGSGKAFWIVSKNSLTINRSVTTPALNTSGNFEISLQPGWNLICNPFAGSIPWSRIQNANNTAASIFTFNGSFVSSVNFDPYVGYYYFNGSPGTVLLVLKVPYYSLFGNIGGPIGQSFEGWKVTMTLSSQVPQEETPCEAWFGISLGAKRDMDEFDVRKPRSLGLARELFFDRPEWDAEYPTFVSDIRAQINDVETWNFKVSAEPSRPARLVFGGISAVPSSNEIYLVDEANGVSANLRLDSTYSFVSPLREIRFSVVVGSKEAVLKRAAQTLPVDYDLSYNFPNPFNPTTSLRLSFPAQSRVNLVIFNILGQKTRTLYSGEMAAGIQWFTWDGKDDQLAAAPSGVYYCRLEIEGRQGIVRRMVLVK